MSYIKQLRQNGKTGKIVGTWEDNEDPHPRVWWKLHSKQEAKIPKQLTLFVKRPLTQTQNNSFPRLIFYVKIAMDQAQG